MQKINCKIDEFKPHKNKNINGGNMHDGIAFIDAKVAMADVELLSPDQKTVDKESLNMTRFLNRLLGLPVDLQNLVFRYFTDTLAEIIKRVKRAGRWDGGILDYGATGEQVVLLESKEYVGDAVFGTATTELHKVNTSIQHIVR